MLIIQIKISLINKRSLKHLKCKFVSKPGKGTSLNWIGLPYE
jgi:hypothetical protein